MLFTVISHFVYKKIVLSNLYANFQNFPYYVLKTQKVFVSAYVKEWFVLIICEFSLTILGKLFLTSNSFDVCTINEFKATCKFHYF